jgi:hypothetical protein
MVLVRIAMLLLCIPASLHAEILCERAPEITPVLPKFVGKDLCVGSVILQGIAYRCGKQEDAAARTQSMLEGIRAGGESACVEYCQARDKNCVGEFDPPAHCGFSVPPKEVLNVGKMAPCADHCEGAAFIYCSIYHASYLRVEPEMFEDFKPNCHCRRKKPAR